MQSHLNPWAIEHDNPIPPKETFRQYYERNIKPGKDKKADGSQPAEK